jgi:hypothetical protein
MRALMPILLRVCALDLKIWKSTNLETLLAAWPLPSCSAVKLSELRSCRRLEPVPAGKQSIHTAHTCTRTRKKSYEMVYDEWRMCLLCLLTNVMKHVIVLLSEQIPSLS